MHKTLIVVGIIATSAGFSLSGGAAAQGFGQVPIATDPAPPAPGGKDLSGVTVTGKKSTAVDLGAKEVVCHSEPVLGSMFPKKVCATKGELALRRQNDQEVARKFSSG
ncbi:MAG: hypothetical protein ACXWKR_17220, partial [Phenylobacterium sp.]